MSYYETPADEACDDLMGFQRCEVHWDLDQNDIALMLEVRV